MCSSWMTHALSHASFKNWGRKKWRKTLRAILLFVLTTKTMDWRGHCVFYFVFLSCVVHLISQRHLFHNGSHAFSHHGRGYAQGVFPSPRNVHLSRLPCVFHVRHIRCSANGAVILPRIVRGKFLKRRILHVVNGSASFNQELLNKNSTQWRRSPRTRPRNRFGWKDKQRTFIQSPQHT